MTDTRMDKFLDSHPRIDRAHMWVWTRTIGRFKQWQWHWRLRKEIKPFPVGGFFLDHGHEPSVIVENYDGAIRGISLVSGNWVVSDLHACGPEPTTQKEAAKRAQEIRDEEWDMEWGYVLMPPHINAYENIWMPDEAQARNGLKNGGAVLLTRQVPPWKWVWR